MNALFRNPFIRSALLAAAMGTAYLIGQSLTPVNLDETGGRQYKVKKVGPRRPQTALEMASIKNQPAEMQSMRQMTTFKFGNTALSMDQMGRFYIGDTELMMLMWQDPKQALDLMAKLPHGELTSTMYRSAFQEWAASNPANGAKAAEAAATLPSGPERLSAEIGLADGWANHDPKSALDWAAALPEADNAALKETITAASQKDPALAAQYVDKLTDASVRNKTILALADNWGNGYWANRNIQDPGATLDWLDQVATGATYDKAVQSIFTQFARNDPATGASIVGKLTDPIDRKSIIAQLSQSWGAHDPSAALAWVQSLPASDAIAQSAAMTSIVSSWSKTDLPAAAAFVQTATDPNVFLTVAPTLAPAMAKEDPQAALTWVNGFPDSPAKAQAVSGVLATVAATDFSSAWNYATALPAGLSRDGAMDSLVSTLSKSNPAQAASLLSQLGSDAATLSATQSVATNWAAKDPAALTAWISAQAAGPVRDTAVVQFVKAQATNDPAAAFALANTIADQPDRATQVKAAVLEMAKKDLPAATQAAQAADLTNSQRQNLLILLSQAPGK